MSDIVNPKFLNLIDNLFQVIFGLSLAYLSGIIIYIGIIYITSQGNKLEEVHKRIPLLIIGIVLVFLSFLIPRLIGLFFEVDINFIQ
jgi:hypothetical protein